MCDKLYRLIPEEGKHLANSHDTEGALRGVYLDDETNKLCGAGEFEEVAPSELDSSDDTDDCDENSTFLKTAAVLAVGAVIGVAADKAYPHVKKYVSEKVVPSAKQFWNTKIKKKKSISTINCRSKSTDLSIEAVHEKYRENMSSDTAKKELIEAYILQVIAARKIKRVAQANIVDENGHQAEGHELIDTLSDPALISEINAILSADPRLLSQDQAATLSDLLGYSILNEGKYIPISSETMHDKLNEQCI